MKKIIKIKESKLVELIKKIITEDRFQNQSEVDAILDKIGKSGIKSLSSKELQILKNPNDVSLNEPEETEEDDSRQHVISALIESNIVDENSITLESDEDGDFFEIHNFKSRQFDFFTEFNGVLACYVEWDELGKVYNAKFSGSGEEYENFTESKIEVYDYIYNDLAEPLSEKDILVWIDDYDDDISERYLS